MKMIRWLPLGDDCVAHYRCEDCAAVVSITLAQERRCRIRCPVCGNEADFDIGYSIPYFRDRDYSRPDGQFSDG